MNTDPSAPDSGSEASSSTAAKRGPGRPKGTAKKSPDSPKNGEWIYDETEELVFIEGAEPADEVVCDGALSPGLSIDPDGTRIWNCASVGGVTAIRRRLRQGDPKRGAELAKNKPEVIEMCESLKARKRCVRWPGAMVVLQYVFKPQTLDTKLSSPRNAKGSLVALRLSPSVSGFISDILHGPLIIDFADSEVSIMVFDNALDIAAWMRRELLAAWSDGKIDESEPVRALPPGASMAFVNESAGLPNALAEHHQAEAEAKEAAGDIISQRCEREETAEFSTDLTPAPSPDGVHCGRCPNLLPYGEEGDTTARCAKTGNDLLFHDYWVAECDAQPVTPEPTAEERWQARQTPTTVSEECKAALATAAAQRDPEPFHPRTVADYLKLPISIKQNTEAAEMGTGDTLEAIFDAVCAKPGCDWPKWRLGATTEELRAVKESGNETLYKTLKRTRLPVYYPSATWTQPRRARANTENVSGTTGLVCLDFDNYPSAEAAIKARDSFANIAMDHMLICTLSASGRGFYAIVVANTGSTIETYKAEAVRLMEWAREQGFDPDSGCCDCTRGRILAVDANALRMGDDWQITPPVYVMAVEAPKPARSGAAYTNDPTKKPSKKKVMGYVARAVEKINAAPTGSRNTAFTSACGAAARLCDLYGYDREDAETRLRFAGETSGLDSKEIESVLRRYGPLAGK